MCGERADGFNMAGKLTCREDDDKVWVPAHKLIHFPRIRCIPVAYNCHVLYSYVRVRVCMRHPPQCANRPT